VENDTGLTSFDNGPNLHATVSDRDESVSSRPSWWADEFGLLRTGERRLFSPKGSSRCPFRRLFEIGQAMREEEWGGLAELKGSRAVRDKGLTKDGGTIFPCGKECK